MHRIERALNRVRSLAAGLFASNRDRYESPAFRALHWVLAQKLPLGGIRVESRHPNAYPEVTGYLVPTLLNYGERELAAELTRWLVCIQRSDGSYTDPDHGEKYTFDTGQVLRGLLAARDLVPQAGEAAGRAARYLLCQLPDGGERGFRQAYAGTNCPETVALYVLPPLVQAADCFEMAGLRDAVRRCLDYYVGHPHFLRIDDLSHFLAYELEALIDLGRSDLATPVLDKLRGEQKTDGSVRGIGGAKWVCTPGLAQLAICWYKVGQWEAADKAMAWLEAHQERDGGFRGSYGRGAAYKPDVEISWAPKFYLDAHLLRVASFFNRKAELFPNEIPPDDGRVEAILSRVRSGNSVLDVGCGKGRFLKAVREAFPDAECVGVDPSPALQQDLPPGVRGLPGSLESIPCPENTFDVVFAVESLEHSANVGRAIAEMTRVAKPGGWVMVIDKQAAHWHRIKDLPWARGKMPPWERWPDIEQLKRLLLRGCDEVSARPVAYGNKPAEDGLMVVWEGRKPSRLSGAQWHEVLMEPNVEQKVVDAVRLNRLSDWARVVMLETAPGEQVMEIGSGTGQISLQLAQAGRCVSCLDTSRESLEFIRRCAAKLDVPVTTVCADATQPLPFQDEQFDCVWSSGLLEHFVAEERRAMLREWARVCRGKLLNLVPNGSSLAYRAGKMLQERAGLWPYGLEMPLVTLRDDYEAIGLAVIREFSVGSHHSLSFLPESAKGLRTALSRLFEEVPERELDEWNQGYLLVTIGTKRR